METPSRKRKHAQMSADSGKSMKSAKGKKGPSLGKAVQSEINNRSNKAIGKVSGAAHKKVNELSSKVEPYVGKPIRGALQRAGHDLVNEGTHSAKKFIKEEGRNLVNQAGAALKSGAEKVKEGASNLWERAKKRLKIG